MSPAEKILVIDRGHAELAYPASWSADPDPGGHLRLVDPTRTVRLEVSYLRLPEVPREALPSLETQVHLVLADVPSARDEPVHTDDRGDAWLAWADYPTSTTAAPLGPGSPPDASADAEPDEPILEATEDDDDEPVDGPSARTRLLLIANGRFQALLTFNYLEADAAAAIAVWTRIVATTRLGDGSQLARPEDHWSMRGRA